MKIYVIGGGAIGLPLAAFLKIKGEDVTVVRTSLSGVIERKISVTVQFPDDNIEESINSMSLDGLKDTKGLYVVTAKAFMNSVISSHFIENDVKGPVVLMQNGLGVEDDFSNQFFDDVFRVVLYFTSEKLDEYVFSARIVSNSPLGSVKSEGWNAEKIIEHLNNKYLKLSLSQEIQKEVWRKATLNVAFNSICPLSYSDNGIFIRDKRARDIAEMIIDECIRAAQFKGVSLDKSDLMDRLEKISTASNGTLISTLQDINNNNRTEMDYLNHFVAKTLRENGVSSSSLIVETLGWLVDILSSNKKNQ